MRTSFPASASTEDSCELDAVFGFAKRRGLAIWTGWTSWRAMITRVPRFVRRQSQIAKSFAKRMQPCEAGWPGKTPACSAIPDQVIRCM